MALPRCLRQPHTTNQRDVSCRCSWACTPPSPCDRTHCKRLPWQHFSTSLLPCGLPTVLPLYRSSFGSVSSHVSMSPQSCWCGQKSTVPLPHSYRPPWTRTCGSTWNDRTRNHSVHSTRSIRRCRSWTLVQYASKWWVPASLSRLSVTGNSSTVFVSLSTIPNIQTSKRVDPSVDSLYGTWHCAQTKTRRSLWRHARPSTIYIHVPLVVLLTYLRHETIPIHRRTSVANSGESNSNYPNISSQTQTHPVHLVSNVQRQYSCRYWSRGSSGTYIAGSTPVVYSSACTSSTLRGTTPSNTPWCLVTLLG